MSKPYRRRNYFINRSFQGRFILKFLILSCIGSLLAVALFTWFALKRMDTVLYSMKIPASSTSDILLKEIVYANAFAFLFVVLAFLITASRIFKRIKYPLNRIRGEIAKFISGDLKTRITLREDDEFKDFADHLNSMADALSKKYAVLNTHAQQLNESCAQLKSTQDGVATKPLTERLLYQIDALENDIKAFKK